MSSPHLIIKGREKDLGSMTISRTLPNAKKRSVGPFVFVDHMGPIELDETHRMSVRPHPHIGLATVTYLFEGRGYHHDSLGSKQVIHPGDLNLMIAGKGIVHSETTPPEDLKTNKKMHGVQIWVALPLSHEDCEPSFNHWPKEQFPEIELCPGINAKLLIGEFNNVKSPVTILSRTLFIDCQSEMQTNCELSLNEKEIGIEVISGQITVDGQVVDKNDLIVISDPKKINLQIKAGTRFIIIGGDPHPEPRYIWWNFVSSSKEKIRKAAQSWKDHTFGTVEGEPDYIPLPDTPLP